MNRGLLALVLCCPLLAASAFEVRLANNGDVELGESGARLGLHVFGEGWSGTAVGAPRGISKDDPIGRMPDLATGTVLFDMTDKGGRFASGRVTLLKGLKDAVGLSVDVLALEDRNPETIALTFDLKCEDICGLDWTLDGTRKGKFPEKYGNMAVVSGKAKTVAFTDPHTRKPVTFTFAEPIHVLLQDNRRWTADFSFRFSIAGTKRKFLKGEQRSFFCTITHPEGVTVDYAKPVVVSRGPDWVALDYRKDILAGSALDFSGMGLNEAPAGKYGWLKAVGPHFEFERRPGRPQRFYGVNLCFAANAPEHALADQVVTRLKRLGYNTIRIHHYENEICVGAAKGAYFNAEKLDRFDYLAAKAIESGLYLTTDLFVSRTVPWRDIGFDRPGSVPMNIFKNLVALHEPTFENWKTFSRNFLLHRNPYTGRRYVDEPGLPLISFVNEGTLSWVWQDLREMEPCRTAWRTWLAERRAKDPQFASGVSDDPAKAGDFYASAAIQCFMADMEAKSSRRQRAFLASLGSKALFTSQNCDDHQPMIAARETYDYVDSHFYVDHPSFLGHPWRLPSKCANANPVRASSLAPVAVGYTRLADRPFTITEWNFSGPGMYRGVGGIMTGAFASLQDWDGLWRFAYSHNLEGLRDGGGNPGYFDMAGDPLGQASDRASVCLFLRGDLGTLGEKIALRTEGSVCQKDRRPLPCSPVWKDEAWKVQVARTTKPAEPGYRTYPLADVRDAIPFSPKGCEQLKLDRTRGALVIDTSLTAGGFAPSGSLEAGPLRIDVGDVAATVWASSVDGRPLRTSKRILVTHLTDVQADGNVYADKAKTVLLKWGSGIVVRKGRARVEIALENPADHEVWGLETTGRRLERLPVSVEDGRLVFTADVVAKGGARMLYEIVAKAEPAALSFEGLTFDGRTSTVTGLDVAGVDWGAKTAGRKYGVWMLTVNPTGDVNRTQTVYPELADEKTVRDIPGGRELVWRKFKDWGGGDAVDEVRARIVRDGIKLRWRLGVTMKDGWELNMYDFPRLATRSFAGKGDKDRVVTGAAEGGVMKDVANGPYALSGYGHEKDKDVLVNMQLPGTAAQLFCRYDDERLFYFACENEFGGDDALVVMRYKDDKRIESLWRHRMRATGRFEMDFDVVTAALAAKPGLPCDWYDAADLYREWASKTHFCARTLLEKKELADFYRSGPIYYPFNRHWLDDPDYMATYFAARAAEGLKDVPSVASCFGWEHWGEWVGLDYTPFWPSDDIWGKCVKVMRAAKARPFLWPSTYHYALKFRTPDYVSNAWRKPGTPAIRTKETDPWLFDHTERAIAEGIDRLGMKDIKGNWKYRVVWMGTGGDQATLCYYLDECRDIFRRTTVDPLMARGCVVMQMDQFNMCMYRCCFDPTHGHPVGFGRWRVEALRKCLDTANAQMRAVNPEACIGFEGPCQFYLDQIAMQDVRDCRSFKGDWANVFTYLYHEYVLPFQAGCHENRYWWAKTAAEGQVPQFANKRDFYDANGRATPEHALDVRFFTDWAKLYHGAGRKFLSLGRHIRPPRLICETLRYTDNWRGIAIDKPVPAVFHAAYLAADGTKAVSLVNATDEPRECTLAWPDGRQEKIGLAPREIALKVTNAR